jgi:hypothetical protein
MARTFPVSGGLATLVLLLSACGGRPARVATAPVRVIAVGQQATSTLLSTDPRLSDNSVYHLWRFAGNAGQTIQIDMISSSFDAFLILQDANGNELIRNDDGGEGLNARIVYTLPSTAQYRVIANTYRQGAFGQYTLRLSAGGAATPGGTTLTVGVRGTISLGQTISGTLVSTDPRLVDRSVYHAYLFSGRAGQRITLEVMSEDFDAYAIIQDASGTKLTEDDDSGGNLNARLSYTLPYTGTYRLVANAYREGSYGRYRIAVR